MARSAASRAWALGGAIFAGTMMIMIGVFQVLMGIAAIAQDEFFATADGYVYDLDTTTWGWIHLILGALIFISGLFVFSGASWARGVGIGLALLSAIDNFFFIPYYPLWSLAVIALDIFVIWALATVGGRQPAAPEERAYATGRHHVDVKEDDWEHVNRPTVRRGDTANVPTDVDEVPPATTRGTVRGSLRDEAGRSEAPGAGGGASRPE